MQHGLYRAAAVMAVALCARLASADVPVGRDGLPLYAGDLSVANDVVNGNAHLMTIGDSITFDITPRYAFDWHPKAWSGVVIGPNFPAGEYKLPESSVSSFTVRTTRSAPGPAGLAPVVPSAQVEYVFSGSAAPAIDSDPKTLANRFYELGLDPSSLGPAANWANAGSGNVTLTPLIYANPNGAAAGTTAMSVRVNSLDTPAALLPLNGTAATPTLVGPSVTIPAQTWDTGRYLAVDFRVAAGAAPAAGSNLTIAGVRISSGGPGLQLAATAQGGYRIEDFLNDQATPLSTLQQYVTLTDSNVALVAIGVNGLGVESSADFKTNLQALIDRYRAARPDMKFVLMTTYDIVNPSQTFNTPQQQMDYNQDMLDVARGNAGVMFMNEYGATPDWATLNSSGLLADGTHPNDAGADYFANAQWGLLSQAAAASTPEPGTVGLVMLAAGGMALRRGRRKVR